MNKTLNKNSLEAHKMVHQQMLNDHWGKILFAMRVLGVSCSSEAIAKRAGMKESQTYRRMSELLRDNLVYVSGKGLTSSGRPCALYSLTQHGREKQESIAATMPPPNKQPFIQNELFQ